MKSLLSALACFALCFSPAVLAVSPNREKSSADTEKPDDDAPVHKKKKPAAATPAPGKRTTKAPAGDDDEKAPAKKAGPDSGNKTSAPKSADEATDDKPAPKKKGTGSAAKKEGEGTTEKKRSGEPSDKTADDKPDAKTDDPAATPTPSHSYAPSASIATSELLGFTDQPPRVQKLITDALELAKLNLTYKFGSDDPASGGMDCSGAVSYLLKQQGLKDVPRDSAGQYVWARKNGQFFAVISKKPGGFEFADILPGDLMFWSGTYNADRDPPVTHSMIFLGVQRKRGQYVMWGSSDGRSYDGKARNGVSVFDFKMPRVDAANPSATKADFLGYARIPGLREELSKPGSTTAAASSESEPAKKKSSARKN